MTKGYKHLTYDDRLKIAKWLDKGMKVSEIAELLDKSEPTIYKEIKRYTYMHRNTDYTETKKYNPDLSQQKYEETLSAKGPGLKIDKDIELANYIEEKILNDKYSPEAVLLDIKEKKLPFKTTIKSVQTIYSYIRKGIFASLSMEKLPYRKKKKKQIVKRARKAAIGTSIEKRPEHIENREEFGHWEMDCVIGKQKNKKTLLVLTERKTRYEIILLLKSKTIDEVRKALNRLEKKLYSCFYSLFKSITVDNGAEFSNPNILEKALYRVGKRTDLFYCHPYSSSERGSNENQNKLVRRHFPKSFDFDMLLKKPDIAKAQTWINNYPRKIFNGKSAQYLFDIECEKLGLNIDL